MTLEQIYQAYFQNQLISRTFVHREPIVSFLSLPTGNNSITPIATVLKTPARFGFLNTDEHPDYLHSRAFHADGLVEDAPKSFADMFEYTDDACAKLTTACLRDQPGAAWKFCGFNADCQMFFPFHLMFIKNTPSDDYWIDTLDYEWNANNIVQLPIGTDDFQALIEFGNDRAYLIEASEIELKSCHVNVHLTITEILNRQKTRRFQTLLDDDRQIDNDQSAWQITYYTPAE